MAENTPNQAASQFFDGIIERQATLFDTIRSAADRYHRFNRSILEGARHGVQDWTEISRKAVTNPTDVVAVYEAVAEAVGNAQSRNIALAREWLEDQVEAQREVREVLRQSFGDVREAVQRAQDGAPAFIQRWGRRRNGNAVEAAAAEA
jgi:hypothetical protein